MCSDMRALLPLSPPVLGSLYGARAKSKAASQHAQPLQPRPHEDGEHPAALWKKLIDCECLQKSR